MFFLVYNRYIYVMRKAGLLFFIGFMLTGCSKQERCGDIIDKIAQDGRYFFIFDPNSNINLSANQSNIEGGIPDNRLSGEVSQAIYSQFSVGEEYCQ